MAPSTTPPQLVTTAEQLSSLTRRLGREHLLGFDTEAASFHRYRDRVYLIQVSSPSETAVIDPLAVTELRGLFDLLADPRIEVVFHDADYDMRSLDRDYGVQVRNMFDTRIAAQLLGEPGIGLGALLEKYFGVRLDKQFQRADWSRRPLTDDMLAYAAADTAHLPALKARLEEELRARGRLEWAREEFERLERVRWNAGAADGPPYLRLKGVRALQPRSLAVVRALYDWREDKARSQDRAPFRIMTNEVLMALAENPPGRDRSPVMPQTLREKHGPEILATIREALELPPDQWPKFERKGTPRPDPETEARVSRLKLFRNQRAKELGLEPGVLCPNGTLEAIARAGTAVDTIPELRRWQREALGVTRIAQALRGGGPAGGEGPYSPK